MKLACTRIPYRQTQAFADIVLDYLDSAPVLSSFYAHPPDLTGLEAALHEKSRSAIPRTELVEALKQQYAEYTLTAPQIDFLNALQQPNAFTITTAHQPNLFTGPLYFLYKIVHAIRLAEFCRQQWPDKVFVPVFFMGSEDADLDELGHYYLYQQKVTWPTRQSGAVGRMNTEGIDEMINAFDGQFGGLNFGPWVVELLRNAYGSHANMQQATLYLVNELFKDQGLLVLVPDAIGMKRMFAPIMRRELLEGFSYQAISATREALTKHYPAQVEGRQINLFYLFDYGRRERIEKHKDHWMALNSSLRWTKSELLEELDTHPERFSPNVVLRALMQEHLLPNIAFIGGGGELAYWLQLKQVFYEAGVPFPVLFLRNSFMLLGEKQQNDLDRIGLEAEQLFLPLHHLQDKLVQAAAHFDAHLDTMAEAEKLFALYRNWQRAAAAVDPTLEPHVAALHMQALKGLHGLEKKMKRAQRRKLGDKGGQLVRLKNDLFPHGSMQERIHNAMPYLAEYGPAFLQVLYQQSLALEQQFTIAYIKKE